MHQNHGILYSMQYCRCSFSPKCEHRAMLAAYIILKLHRKRGLTIENEESMKGIRTSKEDIKTFQLI